MHFKALLFLLASLLLVSTKGIETVPAAAPPKPAIPVKAPTPTPAPIPIKTPPPAKAPTPAPVAPKPPVAKPAPVAPKPPTVAPRPLIKKPADCYPQCGDRCSLHSRPNVCLRACNTCCVRCKCVPPGTAGNKEVCGKCYAGMTTKGGRSKCP
uniref:Uncharacterized protein n=1 Tax=Kalanchoe fedtschenkoi TaxID=63787 RepID=A0A7N0TN18_KALFE